MLVNNLYGVNFNDFEYFFFYLLVDILMFIDSLILLFFDNYFVCKVFLDFKDDLR